MCASAAARVEGACRLCARKDGCGDAGFRYRILHCATIEFAGSCAEGKDMGLIVWLIVGAVAGWLAGLIVRGYAIMGGFEVKN